MSIIHVAVLIGSLRRDSINRKLAQAMMRLAPSGFRFAIVELDGLPMYNADYEHQRPERVSCFTRECSEADAVLFVTPEYNRSLPAVLKNAIDWGSKPKDNNVWRDKPVATCGASPGSVATAAAQLHLRQIMGAVEAHVMGGEAYISFRPALIDDDGGVNDERTRDFLRAYVDPRLTSFALKKLNTAIRECRCEPCWFWVI